MTRKQSFLAVLLQIWNTQVLFCISTQLQQPAVTFARTTFSTQLQQLAVRSRRKAGTEEGKAVGVQQAEKHASQQTASTTNISGTTNKDVSSTASKTETSPRSNNTKKLFSSAVSRSEASPQDPPSSGSTRSVSSARDPESVRTGIGPAEAGGRDPQRKRARNEGRGPEVGGEGIPV